MLNLGATFCRKYRAAAGIGLAMAVVSFIATPAESRHWRAHHRHGWTQAYSGGWRHRSESIRYRNARANRKTSNFAAIVVDGNSGQTLYARNENDLRFPASITKVMTLYLLFEQLEQGQLRLDSNIRVSAFAAAQKPTKLGLDPGELISVEDAINAVVTRSANDIAAAIAETIAGDEERFAELMTQKARALGMRSTHFANASGLPNATQVTTARDLALLGRAIEERFPRYYRYFSTRVFYYRRAAIVNHNHLLDRIKGMDGIKTGYTNASGFNLLTSVKRNGHYIVAVVLGGASARGRDRIMADLIEGHIENGAAIHTASVAAGSSAGTQPARAAHQTGTGSAGADSRSDTGLGPAFTQNTPSRDLARGPIQVASLNAGDLPPEKPRPAFVSGAPKPAVPEFRAGQAGKSWRQARTDGSTMSGRTDYGAGLSTTTPSAAGTSSGTTRIRAAKIADLIQQSSQNSAVNIAGGHRPAAARTGWMIQIGATTGIDKAAELIARARSEGPKSLTRAQAFTEKVQKGSETLYRARFAGLEEDTAQILCKTLKRSGFSCFATRD
ncbi:MAG: D-alanyl-D-alanine carboxypeptidase [Beijerinckiaceae bacterium]|nr:D-alanyl-D-alanine carboxypeptidase [Beijerinckiaceae bacterium]